MRSLTVIKRVVTQFIVVLAISLTGYEHLGGYPDWTPNQNIKNDREVGDLGITVIFQYNGVGWFMLRFHTPCAP
jgi:hypothetical protein